MTRMIAMPMPTMSESMRQPAAADNGRAPALTNGAANGAAKARAEPCHRLRVAAPPPTMAEPPSRAVGRLAGMLEQPGGGVTAVIMLRALLRDVPGTATADIAACLEDLCRDLAPRFARPDTPRLTCSCAAHRLPTGTVITLGLITDLLVANAYRFGFLPREGGRIAVSFAALEASIELTIEDSGLVRPATARARADAVTLASLLVAPLGGWLETPKVVGGSRCIVVVPRRPIRRTH